MGLGERLVVEQRVVGSTVTYLHHGVDMGDGTVVHARPDDVRDPFGGGRVVRTSLADFARGGTVRVRNDPPAVFPPAAVASRAESHVGRPGYSPLVANCEHFTTWCATGAHSSRQVDIVVGRATAAVSRVMSAFGARTAAGGVERVVVRTAVGTSIRVGLRTVVPAALAAEAVAMAAEWRAHQAGCSAEESRRAGERAGLAASAVAFATAGAAAGPVGMLTGAVAGAAVWAGGSLAAEAARAVGRRIASG